MKKERHYNFYWEHLFIPILIGVLLLMLCGCGKTNMNVIKCTYVYAETDSIKITWYTSSVSADTVRQEGTIYYCKKIFIDTSDNCIRHEDFDTTMFMVCKNWKTLNYEIY